MEKNIRGVQYGVYSAALVGLAIALRSVRPFKKFSCPQDIPIGFVERHMRFNGRVLRLEPPIGSTPALLQIDHNPIISLNWIRPRSPTLPIHISSVDISPNGLSWLQHIVVGSKVKFTVLKTNPHSASCIVIQEKDNVGLELISLGFASVSELDFTLEKDPLYVKYYQQLLSAENRAEKKGSGMWAVERSISSRLWSKTASRINAFGLGLLRELRGKLRMNTSQINTSIKM